VLSFSRAFLLSSPSHPICGLQGIFSGMYRGTDHSTTIPVNPPRTYSTRLAAVAKRRRLTARASREAQPKVSKPLQEVLDALHLDSEADLILCLLEREAFLETWGIFRDEVIWEPNSNGPVIRTDDLIPQVIQEVKLSGLSHDSTPHKFDAYYHVSQLYSSLIRNLQQKEEISMVARRTNTQIFASRLLN